MHIESVVEKLKAKIETLPAGEQVLLQALATRMATLTEAELRRPGASAAAGMGPKTDAIESDRPTPAAVETEDAPAPTVIESDGTRPDLVESD